MSSGRAVVPMLLAVACASAGTDGTTYREANYRGVEFDRVAVIAEGGDSQYRARFEALLVADLRGEHVWAVEGSTLLPSAGETSEAERADVLRAAGVQAALYLRTVDFGTEKTVVGGWAGVSTQVSPWAQFEAELEDVASGETAWRISAAGGGNVHASFDTIAGSFCDTVTEALLKERVVRRQP